MTSESSNKRSYSDDTQEKQTKRQKTGSVRFEGIDEENEGKEQSKKTEIYSDADVQRIRRLRKDKRKYKGTDYLDTEEAYESQYTAEPGEPAMEPFSMDGDMKYGRFDEEGSFIFKQRPRRIGQEESDSDDSTDDPWLKSLKDEKKKIGTIFNEIVKQDKPHENEFESKDTKHLMMELISYLEENETPLLTLKRLKERAVEGEDYTRKPDPKKAENEDEERAAEEREASRNRSKLQRKKQSNIKKRMSDDDQKIFNRITELSNVLMLVKSVHNVLSMPRKEILKLACAETGNQGTPENDEMLWQFRWKKSVDQAIYGPYTSNDLFNWVQAGYIKDETPVDLREVTADGDPIDGVWRDWKSVRLDGGQFKVEDEEIIKRDERNVQRKEEMEKRNRKEAELADSDDEEI